MGFVIEILIKATLILAAAAVLGWTLRRRSASLRHLIWVAALTGVLLLPAISMWIPAWRTMPPLPVGRMAPAGVPRIVMDVTSEASRWPTALELAACLWILGATLLVGRGIRAHWRTRALVGRARPFGQTGVVISGEINTPMVCGLPRPVILLPESAEQWPPERLRLVLAHESMHIRRHDLVTQLAGALACVVYWFHPLVWWAAARLRLECERACDDGILAEGALPSTYAEHLVEIARAVSWQTRAIEGAIPMAHMSHLEQRLQAMFNPKQLRHAAGPRMAAVVAVAAAAIVIPVAALQTPNEGESRVAGIVQDQSGGRIPGASITVELAGSSRREFTRTNDTGEFQLAPLPNGIYRVTVRKPGFAQAIVSGIEASGPGTAPITVVMNVGRIQESLEINGGAGAVPRPAAIVMSPGPPQRIKIGGAVQPSKILVKTQPTYPASAKADGVEGKVLLITVISTQGVPIQLEQVNQLVDKRLVDASVEAVKNWRFEPTLLNGNPVEVVTEIEMNFTLAK